MSWHRLLFTAAALGCAGCLGGPGGTGFRSPPDAAPARLEVRPESASHPIGSRQVFIATIYDGKKTPRGRKRVEWVLEGPGTIVEIDETATLAGRGHLTDSHSAYSYTDTGEHLVTRGNDDPDDDFMIRPGQTYCVVTGAVEGETVLSVRAPDITDWDRRNVVVRSKWVDCRWEFPPNAVGRAGGDHLLSSRVLRHSDRQPVPNYRVKYTITGGPAARLFPHPSVGETLGAQELVAISDINGQANVRIKQDGNEPGETKVAVEILRGNDASQPNGIGTLVSRSTTVIEWQGSKVVLSMTAPETAGVGEEVPVTYVARNTGSVASEGMTVKGYIPDGFEFVNATPPATRNGAQLVWQLTSLPGDGQHLLQARFRANRVGAMTSTASLVTNDGARADQGATTDVTAGQMRVAANAPEAGIVGESVPVAVTVSNAGNGPLTNVRLRVQHDRGLAHDSQQNPVESTIERIDPGQSKSMTVTLAGRESGQWNIRVGATADGDSVGQTRPLFVLLKRAELELTASAVTPRVYMNQRIEWGVVVRNNGELPISNVIVRGDWPDSVVVRDAPNGRIGRGQVQWDVGTLAPNESREFRAIGEALALTGRASLRVNATGDAVQKRQGDAQLVSYRESRSLEQRAEAAVEVLGVPALQVAIIDLQDPITVTGRSRYTIRLTNKGTLPAREVDVVATLPPQLKFLRGFGPKPPSVKGNEVAFSAIDSIAPNQTIEFAVDVDTVAPGDARFRVEVRSPTLAKPLTTEEATRVLPGGTQ